jgi:hypothetical protein
VIFPNLLSFHILFLKENVNTFSDILHHIFFVLNAKFSTALFINNFVMLTPAFNGQKSAIYTRLPLWLQEALLVHSLSRILFFFFLNRMSRLLQLPIVMSKEYVTDECSGYDFRQGHALSLPQYLQYVKEAQSA